MYVSPFVTTIDDLPAPTETVVERLIADLRELGQKQNARLTLEDGTTVDGRVSQSEFSRDERIRVELSTDSESEYDRYQVRARADDGGWTPVEVRGFRSGDDDWTVLGTLASVTPLEQYRTMTSGDMDAQENTGTEE